MRIIEESQRALSSGEGEPAGTAADPPEAPFSGAGARAVQRRTLRILFATQIFGGIGLAIGFSVGALLAAEMAGIGMSGLAQSAAVVGAALLAIPATRVVRQHGRRPSLSALYLAATAGAAIIPAAALTGSVPLLFLGFFLFGAGTTAGLQARYSAVDLAPPELRGRHLSLVVWATTLGAVAGPNLAPLAGTAMAPYGIPTLAGPFVFSGVLFAVAALLLLLLLRPDPLIFSRDLLRGPGPPAPAARAEEIGMPAALRAVAAHREARLGITATAVGHLVMVGVMAMTPVHILGAGHDAAHTLRIVGVVLSLHVAGMFAFAPLTGWLADRFGRRSVIVGGTVLLLAACVVSGTAGHDVTRLAVGMWLLGLGWSGTMVAGSTLLTESVPAHVRPSAQGLSDLTMGLGAASAGALSGVVLSWWGFPLLTVLAGLAALSLLVLTVSSRRAVLPRPG